MQLNYLSNMYYCNFTSIVPVKQTKQKVIETYLRLLTAQAVGSCDKGIYYITNPIKQMSADGNVTQCYSNKERHIVSKHV